MYTNVELQSKNMPKATYTVHLGQYPAAPQQTYLRLTDEHGAPMMTATLCIPEIDISGDKNEHYALIKNYSENEGIFEALIASGLIEDTGVKVPLGYDNEAPLVRVTADRFTER